MNNNEINEVLNKQESIMNKMMNDYGYVNWLTNFLFGLDGYFQNVIYNDDFKEGTELFEYAKPEAGDIENGKNLYYFYEALKQYAYENNIPAFMDNDKDYYLVFTELCGDLFLLSIGKRTEKNSYSYYCKELYGEEIEFLNDYDLDNKVINFNKVVDGRKEKVKVK